MSYDALRKGRHSLHYQVYCITTVTRNRHRCQSGSLWQRAYYDRAARKDDDIRRIARYIVANPLRAGLVQNIGDYPHWDCIWMTN